jgi:hypothetical protein
MVRYSSLVPGTNLASYLRVPIIKKVGYQIPFPENNSSQAIPKLISG